MSEYLVRKLFGHPLLVLNVYGVLIVINIQVENLLNKIYLSICSGLLQSIEHREDFIKFGRDFEPIRIAQNQTSIAVVERNSQSAHI